VEIEVYASTSVTDSEAGNCDADMLDQNSVDETPVPSEYNEFVGASHGNLPHVKNFGNQVTSC
jgi:hypothetical protein